MKIQGALKKGMKKIRDFFLENLLSMVIILLLISLCVLIWKFRMANYKDIVEAVKISVTVLISMLGFSVSIYVFLNNTFQNRRGSNELEKEIIDSFQIQKRKALGVSVVYSMVAISAECMIVAVEGPMTAFLINNPPQLKKVVYFVIIIGIFAITLLNVYRLGVFTYKVIDYEEGLKWLAKREINTYRKDSCYERMSKGEFLNLVNNIEVLIERLICNHLHAKISTAYDTNLKRAICDGITESGDITTREQLAEDYKSIIDYRNLLLQDVSIVDSADVAMGDQVKSVMNRLFQNYLRSELLTGVNISNLNIQEANLEKASFSNSSLQKIEFVGNTNLANTDFRDSTINAVSFSEANCENINFSGCKLIGVRFNAKMKLHRAIFKDADLSSMGDIGPLDKEGDWIEFKHSNFSCANLTHQDIYNVCFDFSDFTNVRLVDSKIGKSAQKENNTTFQYADMEKADLLRCDIKRCDLQNANLNSATFTYADIAKSNFSECRLNNANFSKSVINDCKFEKSYCTNFSMKGTILKNSQFTYAIMTSADMSGAQLSNVEFNDAVCRNTLWVRTQIEQSNFERCVLANARIVGDAEHRIRISGCNFSYTDLSNSAIANIEFCNCNFLGVDFTNARLINTRFLDCQNLNTAVSEGIWLAEVSFDGKQKSILEKGKQHWRYEQMTGSHVDGEVDDGDDL